MELNEAGATVKVTSFGFEHGPAPDAHLLLDLRTHFRDPHVTPELRYLTADDEPVRQAVLGTPGIRQLVKAGVLAVEAYQSGPSAGPVVVACGCVGGRHRAPGVATAIGQALVERGYEVVVDHRDKHKPVISRYAKEQHMAKSREARAGIRYFAADEASSGILDRLCEPTTAVERAGLLRQLADLEDRMDQASAEAWPEDETPDEDGYTPSQSKINAAKAFRYIAAAEEAAVCGAPRELAPHNWEVAAGHLFDQFATTTGSEQRADLLAKLYGAVEPLIGGQAAAAIDALRRAYAGER